MNKIEMEIPINISLLLCKSCLFGKQYETPFPKGESTCAYKLLELLHFNICGPMKT
jgi:hypothetical protein